MAGSLGCVASAVLFMIQGYPFSGLAALGVGFLLAGISIFAFFGFLAATKGILLLTKKIVLGVKSLFIKKEGKQ